MSAARANTPGLGLIPGLGTPFLPEYGSSLHPGTIIEKVVGNWRGNDELTCLLGLTTCLYHTMGSRTPFLFREIPS